MCWSNEARDLKDDGDEGFRYDDIADGHAELGTDLQSSPKITHELIFPFQDSFVNALTTTADRTCCTEASTAVY